MSRLFECKEDLQVSNERQEECGLAVGFRMDAGSWRKLAKTWTECPAIIDELDNASYEDEVINIINQAFELRIEEVK